MGRFEEMQKDNWWRVSMNKDALIVEFNPNLKKQNVRFMRKVDGYWLFATADHANTATVRAQEMLDEMEAFG